MFLFGIFCLLVIVLPQLAKLGRNNPTKTVDAIASIRQLLGK